MRITLFVAVFALALSGGEPMVAAGQRTVVIKNARAYPAAVVAIARQALQSATRTWRCPTGGEVSVSAQIRSATADIVSLSCDVVATCKGNAPEGRSIGVTVRRRDGKRLALERFACTPRQELKQLVLRRATAETTKKADSECPPPEFSGEFFLEGKDAVFIEFFPSHLYEDCEVEVRIPLVELQKH